jgi:hypothetical protein
VEVSTKEGEESSDGMESNIVVVSASQAKVGKEESTKEEENVSSGRTVSAENVTFFKLPLLVMGAQILEGRRERR